MQIHSRVVFKLHNPLYNATYNEALNSTDADVVIWQVISEGIEYSALVDDPLYLAQVIDSDEFMGAGNISTLIYEASNLL